MNCKQFEDLAHEIAAGKVADEVLLRDATEHAAACNRCGELLAEARTLQSSLSALCDHDRAAGAPAHMESNLRAAFLRAHKEAVPQRAARPWIAVAGIAAVLMFAVLLVAHYFPRFLNRGAQPNPVAVSPTPPAPEVAHPVKVAPQAINKDVARHHPRRQPQESETKSDFVRLPYADDPSTIEYGIVVRYQLPRSALAWLGLDAPISETGDLIVADLFLNQSGMPQAIRFVR